MRRGAILALAAVTLSAAAGWAWSALDRTPHEVLRHVDRRLEGHPGLQALLSLPLQWAHEMVEPAGGKLPSPLALRGALAEGLPLQTYDARGVPLEAAGGVPSSPAPRRLVGSAAELVAALDAAQAGDVVELLPGRYELAKNVWLKRAGTAQAPIVLRAATLGTVRIDLRSAEGFVVAAPYWIFENLHVVGACVPASRCEHAFHVVGKGRAVVVRNNVLQDFNNAIKANGQDGLFPDHGLVQRNHVFNTRVRDTDSPVVGIDVLGASGWRVVDNLIADIAKTSKDSPSYAAFMKGGGSDGRFERNLVACRLAVEGERDIRVGLSLGGGGTAGAYLRQGERATEFERGVIANNIVAFCNDFGIDLNHANGARVAFNTLIETAGIDMRNPPSNASIYGNLLDGRIRAREGTVAIEQYNVNNAAGLRVLDATGEGSTETASVPVLGAVAGDFCGRPRGDAMTRPGAFATPAPCSLLQPAPLRLLAGEAALNS